MKLKVVVVLGALSGGVLWFLRRKRQKAAADAALWSAATDPVARFGDT